MDDSPQPQLPEIAVSRTSSQKSSKKSAKWTAEGKRPSLPRVHTEQNFHPHWKPGYHHSDAWKRFHNPDPEWRIKWDSHCFPNGRVLIVDYISNDAEPAKGGKRHVAVASQEFQSLPELRHFYSDKKRVHGAALRVIHVQNATWATLFLLKKFNINHPNELVGMPSFAKWAQYEKPRQRNGKPFLNGRSWRGQTDPWRNVSRTAFGLDYLKPYNTESPQRRKQKTAVDAKIMHLNAYEDSRSPYGYDVSVQRMSVYVQRNLGPPNHISPDIDVKNPYKHMLNGSPMFDSQGGKVPLLDYLDNSNTVIIFENSASMQLEDCLVQPRNDFENRWRRLSFYLRKEDVLNDSRLAAQCTNFILVDIFHGLGVVWDQFLSAAEDHVAMLEEKIFDNPADESRAPELWTNQAAWLKVDKIMWIHADLVREMQVNMRELADVDDEANGVEVDWMASTTSEYERLSHNVSEDLVQPTNNLSDLMYKSVGIRDSRQSLQLGLSMWRLSWITFIFLPLTFIVGLFGMNVDAFADNPSIGWYFLAAVVLMIFVLLLWYCVKHSLQRSRQTPFQRGLYESLFNDLEEEYPQLWTSAGAAEDVEPQGTWNRIKWRLIRRWFAPEKTINKRLYSALAPDDQRSELGAWAAIKQQLLFRWLGEMRLSHQQDILELVEAGASSSTEAHYEMETINELAKHSTPVVVAEAEPAAVAPIARYGLRPLTPEERRQSLTSEGRPSSRGSSGIMIEERNLSDSESDAGEVGASSSTQRGRTGRRASQ
ncbi:hypothetical protein PRZ48_010495 [Zasmidium cellare]|uniref:Uncharacterized protein n=1 Tax=Zasmidium cellare TaxID=395010 RepID=A0ABR0E9C5_ZASCE|nr:hypothetical protein PRZ48_010495 [Zasmidium cellare]